jgi:hypothetical protein
MKNIILAFIGLLLACSRDTGGIWVELERPMYNRFEIRSPHDTLTLASSDSGLTTIFDTEQMSKMVATVRGGDVDYRRSRFRIALVDYNNNGLFNEVGIDKFLLDRYGLDSTVLIYPLKPNLAALQPFTQFRVDHQFFEIGYIDEKGRSLEIYPIGRSDALKPVIFNTQVPNIKIRDREGRILSLADLREPAKPLVVVLWQNRHHVWANRIEELILAHQQDPEGMTLIGLHIPGNYFKQVNLESIDSWLRGRMPLYWGETEHALELNNGELFPGVIFFDRQGVWQGSGLRPEEVLRLVGR